MRLILAGALRAGIVGRARAAFPRECCGLIEGVREGDVARALVLYPTGNIAASASRFEIDPGDHFAALKTARANGRALIGCYHSHPGGGPTPSARDVAGAGEEGFLWLIAALARADDAPALAAFSYSAGGFLPVEIDEAGADLVTSSGKAQN